MINENKTLLGETHYYPFGLTMKGISLQNATPSLHNKEKTFQGQQIDEELDLSWVQFKYRNHDPQIGRFIEIDPLANDYVSNSTYAFSENKVTAHVELEGLETVIPIPGGFVVPPIFNPGSAFGSTNYFPGLDQKVEAVAKEITYQVLAPVFVDAVTTRRFNFLEMAGQAVVSFFDRLFSKGSNNEKLQKVEVQIPKVIQL